MTKEEIRVLSIQFQDNEVDTWNSILIKLEGLTNQTGYKKFFTKEEKDLILELKGEEND